MQPRDGRRIRIDARNWNEIDVVDRELVVTIDKINAALADAVNRRNVQLHDFDAGRHRPGSAIECALVGTRRVAHAQCNRRDPGPVARRGTVGQYGHMGVDDDVDRALPIQQYFAGAMPRNGPKAHGLQHLA